MSTGSQVLLSALTASAKTSLPSNKKACTAMGRGAGVDQMMNLVVAQYETFAT